MNRSAPFRQASAMLFSSYEFVFAFLPLAIMSFRFFRWRTGGRVALVWLLAASLIFYAWWDVRFLTLLVGSIAANYTLGRLIDACVATQQSRRAAALLGGAIGVNLLVLGVFKYVGFAVDNVNSVFGTTLSIGHVLLPLGISFFTFEQIAYLVDIKRGGRAERDPLHYALFVAFFPRLVAGPILRGTEVLPQFSVPAVSRDRLEDLAVGLTLFAFGLFKKTVLADGIAPYASPVFAAAHRGEHLDLLAAWGGALAYTFQLYFDFSGYSDMATGAARCFGVRFPMNFYSPYKATSIIEFWRRWHITLSRFLRDYLYVPLGGNRHGATRRYVNLIITMLLGGLWHGANWTFVVWGGLHGAYLIANHGWRAARRKSKAVDRFGRSGAAAPLGWLLTFLAVVVGWVFFRSTNFGGAWLMLSAMVGWNGIEIPSGLAFVLGPWGTWAQEIGIRFGGGSGVALVHTYLWVTALLSIAIFMPNTAELLARWSPFLDAPIAATRTTKRFYPLQWGPSRSWAIVTAGIATAGVLSIARGSEFLYWQF